eukprot:688460-Pleurochrysis_carterae.AAC.2
MVRRLERLLRRLASLGAAEALERLLLVDDRRRRRSGGQHLVGVCNTAHTQTRHASASRHACVRA